MWTVEMGFLVGVPQQVGFGRLEITWSGLVGVALQTDKTDRPLR